MLVYNCRTLIRRLGTQVPRSSTEHFARSLWSLSRVINGTYSCSSREPSGWIIGDTSSIKQPLRTYATATTRSKASTTKKPLAKKATTSRRGSGSKKTAKKTVRKPVKKKAAARKPTKKKTRVTASKGTGRKKTTARKVKKPLTAEEKTKEKIRKLQKVALAEPKRLPASAYGVLQAEIAKERHGLAATEASQRYKNLTPAELEHYNHIANQNSAANDAAYKKWVESHTVDEIRNANNARKLLKRMLSKREPGSPPSLRPGRYPQIKDHRQPVRPTSKYIMFTTDRFHSGDFKNMKAGERAKLVAAEWKQLPANEKENYQRRYEADRSRYLQEYKTVFNRDARVVRLKKTGTRT